MTCQKKSRRYLSKYSDAELKEFFEAWTSEEHTLFLTFLLMGFREQEVVNLMWDDIMAQLGTIKVTAKPQIGFYPKRWEDREVPVPLTNPENPSGRIERLPAHPHEGAISVPPGEHRARVVAAAGAQ